MDVKTKGVISESIDKEIEKKDEVIESQSLLDEQEAKHEFYIMDPDGTLTPVKDYNFSKHKNLSPKYRI